MVFFGSSCEMLRHLGAKMANKSAKLGGALFWGTGGGGPPPPPPPLWVPPGRDLGRGKRYHRKAFWKEVSKVYLERDDWKEYWKVSPEHAEVPSKEGRRIYSL